MATESSGLGLCRLRRLSLTPRPRTASRWGPSSASARSGLISSGVLLWRRSRPWRSPGGRPRRTGASAGTSRCSSARCVRTPCHSTSSRANCALAACTGTWPESPTTCERPFSFKRPASKQDHGKNHDEKCVVGICVITTVVSCPGKNKLIFYRKTFGNESQRIFVYITENNNIVCSLLRANSPPLSVSSMR
jgi:hypothetical protein